MSHKIDIKNFIPELLPIEKSIYQQINDIKTTIIKIFVNRGFIEKSNIDKYIKKLIDTENNEYEYIINLDKSTNYNTEIKNKKIYIKFFDYKISSVNEKSVIGEFIKEYDKEYKFIVVNDITSKTEDTILSFNTQVEIFKYNELKSDKTEHDLVPRHEVLRKEEAEMVLESYRTKKRDMQFIRQNDPIAKYYNMKPGEIVRIYRPSPITCESISYRLVIKSKDKNAKT